jgi:hypothetical protein
MNVIPVIIYAAELAVAAIILFYVVEMLTMPANKRWSRFSGQNGGLAKVDSGFGYAANFSSFACVA